MITMVKLAEKGLWKGVKRLTVGKNGSDESMSICVSNLQTFARKKKIQIAGGIPTLCHIVSLLHKWVWLHLDALIFVQR